MSMRTKPHASPTTLRPGRNLVDGTHHDDDLLNDLLSWTGSPTPPPSRSPTPPPPSSASPTRHTFSPTSSCCSSYSHLTPAPDTVSLSFSPERVNRIDTAAKSDTPHTASETATAETSTVTNTAEAAAAIATTINTTTTTTHSCNGQLQLPGELHDALYDYQRDGVQWLYRKHCTARACLLADEMGLGKMVQVCALLGQLYAQHMARSTIIVAPTTLLPMWQSSLKQWAGLTSPVVELVQGGDVRAKRRTRWRRLSYTTTPCVMLTSYGVLRQDGDVMTQAGTMVDYVVLDEAHTIKSASTATFKAALGLTTRHKIAMTGTPVMNSLEDLWSIFRFLDGSIVSYSRADFGRLNCQLRQGCDGEETSAVQRSAAARELAQMQQMMAPYMLRREKREMVSAVRVSKEDTVVWVRLSAQQRMLYGAIAQSPEVRAFTQGSASPTHCNHRTNSVLHAPDSPTNDNNTKRRGKEATYMEESSLLDCYDSDSNTHDQQQQQDNNSTNKSRRRTNGTVHASTTRSTETAASPLLLLTTLSQICLHPWLSLTETGFRVALAQPYDLTCADVGDIFAGPKLSVCMSLLAHSLNEGRKALVFARSRRVLTMLEPLLQLWGMSYCRLDGDAAAETRMPLVHRFQTDDTLRVCLLTTQVGGVGLNLTAASVVVLMDPSGNPALDAQAMDRVHRVGQTRHVCVYRLVTCGTVEEKMYRNQVVKMLASTQTGRGGGVDAQAARTRKRVSRSAERDVCGESCLDADVRQDEESIRAEMDGQTQLQNHNHNNSSNEHEYKGRVMTGTPRSPAPLSAKSHYRRYFTRLLHMRDMFDVGDWDSSETAYQLARLHPRHTVRPALSHVLLGIPHVCDVSNQAGIHASEEDSYDDDDDVLHGKDVRGRGATELHDATVSVEGEALPATGSYKRERVEQTSDGSLVPHSPTAMLCDAECTEVIAEMRDTTAAAVHSVVPRGEDKENVQPAQDNAAHATDECWSDTRMTAHRRMAAGTIVPSDGLHPLRSV